MIVSEEYYIPRLLHFQPELFPFPPEPTTKPSRLFRLSLACCRREQASSFKSCLRR
ncbi:hypothetical protein RRG08_063234 [Elysia crispata]|uniref:Uncharacterized protein n=1 Tax=Elysia crispata TaxID=231223 RepID=A0AAE0Y9Q6_9GAST|nr:hypothetical protein RRG08_063234 [Elysia crispata]